MPGTRRPTARGIGPSAALSAALLLAACSGPGGLGEELDGRTFEGDHTEGFELVAGTSITLTFSGDQVSLNAGCNTIFGAASWQGDTLEVEEVAATEMGCDEALHEQDDTLQQVLQGAPTFTLDGEALRIEGAARAAEVGIELDERTDAPLEGTHWELDGIEEDGAVSSIPAGVEAALEITDGQANVKYGCNSGGGEVTVAGDTLEFGNLIATLMMCDDDSMKVEQHMASLMQGTVDYSIEGRTLRLTSGGKGLYFTAAGSE